MKTLIAFFAVVAFVSVGAFPTSPILPPPPCSGPVPVKIKRSSSGSSAQTQTGSSQDSVTSVERTDASGRTVRTSTNDHSADSAAANSNERASKETILYSNGDVTTRSGSSKNAAASQASSASKDHRTVITDCNGNSVSERDQASSASAKTAQSSENSQKTVKIKADGSVDYSSSSSNDAASSKGASESHNYEHIQDDGCGGKTRVVKKGNSASKEVASSSDYKGQSGYTDCKGNSGTSTYSGSSATFAQGASQTHDDEYSKRDSSGEVKVKNQGSSASKEVGNSNKFKATNSYTTSGGERGWADYSGNNADIAKGASKEHNIVYTKKDDCGGETKVVNQGSSASKEVGTSSDYKGQSGYTDCKGNSGTSTYSGSSATFAQGASQTHDDEYSKRDSSGEVKVKNQGSSASKEVGNSNKFKATNSYTTSGGERGWADYSGNNADIAKGASKEHNIVYTKKDDCGGETKVVNQGSSASKEVGTSSDYKGQSGYTDCKGNSGTSTYSGSSATFAQGASQTHDDEYSKRDSSGEVKVKNQGSSASKEVGNSNNYEGTNSYTTSGGERGWADYSGNNADIAKGASKEHNIVYTKKDDCGGETKVVNQGSSASKEVGTSSDYKGQSGYTDCKGNSGTSTYSGSSATFAQGASQTHDDEYSKRDSSGEVKVKNQGSSASKEVGNSNKFKATNSYTTSGGERGWADYSGNNADIAKGASKEHNIVYTKKDDCGGETKVVNQGSSASKEVGTSSDYKGQSGYTDCKGNSGTSTYSGSSATFAQGASQTHDDEYSKRDSSGEVKVKNQGSSASKEVGNSNNYEGTNSYTTSGGERGWADYSGNNADIAKGASKEHNIVYTKKDDCGGETKVVNQGSSASKEVGTSSDYKGQSGYTDCKGNSGTSTYSGSSATFAQGASQTHDDEYSKRDSSGEVKVKNQGSSASKEVGNSNNYEGTNSYTTSGGERGWADYSGNNADIAKGASKEHNIVYTKKDDCGGETKVVNQGSSASKEVGTSSDYKGQSGYTDCKGNSGTSTYSGSSATFAQGASQTHDDEYSKRDSSGEVKVKNQGSSASKEVGNSNNYEGTNSYTTSGGERGWSDYSGNNADIAKGASVKHNIVYTKKDDCGGETKMVNKGSSASTDVASSSDYKSKSGYTGGRGNSVVSSSSGDNAAASSAASANHDDTYSSKTADGNTEYRRDKGSNASEKSGSSSNQKNNESIRKADGSWTDTSSKSSDVASHQAASANNESVSIKTNPNGSSVSQNTKTASASVADASSTKDQQQSTTVDSCGNKVVSSSSSSSANSSSASSSSTSTEEEIDC